MEKNPFGLWLKNERIKKGLSLRAFCKIVGKSPAYISKIERGLFPPPSEKTIINIAELFGENKDLVLASAGKISIEIIEILLDNPDMLERLRRNYRMRGRNA